MASRKGACGADLGGPHIHVETNRVSYPHTGEKPDARHRPCGPAILGGYVGDEHPNSREFARPTTSSRQISE